MGVNSCGTTLIDEGTFKNIGAVSWDTTAKTAGFTAVAGTGYFVNTTSGVITVTLPSSPTAGDTVGIADYANTADTNKITIGRNGSNIQGEARDFIINTEGGTIILTYVDATKGWLSIDAAQASDIIRPTFITATGGTITTSGNYKIHTFTGPGTFTVSSVGNPLGGPNTVDYVVVAGGGASAGNLNRVGGAAGAGGFREGRQPGTPYTASPLAATSGIPVSIQGYPITVGGGGTSPGPGAGSQGSSSTFSTITSTGGGGGSSYLTAATTGGSGGGGSADTTGAAGNTPPVSPPQGNSGGNGYNSGSASGIFGGGGGGGATAVGANSATSPSPTNTAGNGGAGATTSISGSPTAYAGGGGGGGQPNGNAFTSGTGGVGGGGAGACRPQSLPGIVGTAGTANTGGGAGGSAGGTGVPGGNGGSGTVIIRYKFQ